MSRRTTALTCLVLASVGTLSACGSSSGSAGPKPHSSPRPSMHGQSPSPAQRAGRHTNRATSSPGSAPATEFHPPGDIPDTTVYIPYKVPGSKVQLKVPEGWGRSAKGGVTTFKDHYNSIAIQVVSAKSPPTVASATKITVPKLAQTATNFGAAHVSRVQLAHGPAVLITYQADSKPDPVTTKVVRDAVERFELWKHGQEAIVTLTGPVSADNVDPWRTVSESVQVK